MRLLPLVLLLLSNLAALAEVDLTTLKHPLKPMLWKVEGKTLQKPSYLFGTLHLADPRILRLHPSAESAYRAADTLAVESLMNEASYKEFHRIGTRTDGKTVKQALGPKLYRELIQTTKKLDPTTPVEIYDNRKTWVIEMFVSTLSWADITNAPLDAVLLRRAKKDAKECWALETQRQSLSGYDLFTETEQQAILKGSLWLINYEYDNKITPVETMLEHYLLGDKVQLRKDSTEFPPSYPLNKKLLDRYRELLLTRRDTQMTQTIERRLTIHPYKSHFIVAGCLHFLGEKSIVQQLRDRGYSVKAIE